MRFSYQTAKQFYNSLVKTGLLKPEEVIVSDMPNIGFSIQSENKRALRRFEREFCIPGSNVSKPKKVRTSYVMIAKNFL